MLRQWEAGRAGEVHLQQERRGGEQDLRGRRAAGQSRQADAVGRMRGTQLRRGNPRGGGKSARRNHVIRPLISNH